MKRYLSVLSILAAVYTSLSINAVFAKEKIAHEKVTPVCDNEFVGRKHVVKESKRWDGKRVYYEKFVNGKRLRSWYKTREGKARFQYYKKNGDKITDVEVPLIFDWEKDGKYHDTITEQDNCFAISRYNMRSVPASESTKAKYGIEKDEMWNYGVTIFNLDGEEIFGIQNIDAILTDVNIAANVYVFKKDPVFEEEGNKPGWIYVFNNKAELLFKRECSFISDVFISPKGNWLVFDADADDVLYFFLAVDLKAGKTFKLDTMPPIWGVNDNCDLLSEDGKVLFRGSDKKPL